MKISFSKNSFLNVYYFIFIFFILYLLIRKIRLGYLKESYQITEFLINYQGGFVRRGLLGEMILLIHNYSSIHPYSIIIFISLISLLTLIFFFLYCLIKKGLPLFFLPLVFFLGSPIIHDFWVRKDILIVLLFMISIYHVSKKNTLNLILFNLFFIVGILIHESIAFIGFPIFFLIIYSNYKSFFKLITIFLPSIFTFILVLYHKGSTLISHEIWNSWNNIPFPFVLNENQHIPAAAVDALSWTLKEGLQYSFHTLSNFNGGIYAPIGWIAILLIIYYILSNTDRLNLRLFGYRTSNHFSRKNISNLLIFQFFSVIPLFILGWDYGRWVFLWVVSSFSIYLLVPQKLISQMFTKTISSYTNGFNQKLDIIFSGTSVLLLSLIIGFPAHSWSLIGSINSSSVVIVLRFVSKIVEYLFFWKIFTLYIS